MGTRQILEKAGISLTDKQAADLDAYRKEPPRITIKLTASGQGGIWVGDFMLPCTRSVRFTSDVNDITRVHVEILAMGGVEVEAEAGALDLDLTVFDRYKPLVVTKGLDGR